MKPGYLIAFVRQMQAKKALNNPKKLGLLPLYHLFFYHI